jgi:hypothetical protein
MVLHPFASENEGAVTAVIAANAGMPGRAVYPIPQYMAACPLPHRSSLPSPLMSPNWIVE